MTVITRKVKVICILVKKPPILQQVSQQIMGTKTAPINESESSPAQRRLVNRNDPSGKPETCEQKDDNALPQKPSTKSIEEEQRLFSRCEEIFLPTMKLLAEAKDDSNTQHVTACIEYVLGRFDTLSPLFIEEYGLLDVVRSVGNTFRNSQHKE